MILCVRAVSQGVCVSPTTVAMALRFVSQNRTPFLSEGLGQRVVLSITQQLVQLVFCSCSRTMSNAGLTSRYGEKIKNIKVTLLQGCAESVLRAERSAASCNYWDGKDYLEAMKWSFLWSSAASEPAVLSATQHSSLVTVKPDDRQF